MGAVVLQHIRVGERTLVGAGAIVTQDLPDNIVAVGIPARARSYAAPKASSARRFALTK
jgi:acetyltransferase-like isoleucine patch superfamily enzyme